MAREIEFYFDCSSPWTYLAFHAVQPLAAELGAAIAWKPILVGGVFNAVNQTVYESRSKPNPLKAAYMRKDLGDWAALYDLKILFPPTVFPVNSVKCMRGAFAALDEGKLVPYATAAFEAYWGDDRDIAREEVLADIAASAGLERQRFFSRLESDDCKGRLRANTDELIRRGGFGSPTMFVGGEMFFGNDRLPLVKAALSAKPSA
ncbi:MAG TPA: 2-hydroxychromene-2-carboxylate isomerase [Reyranella sp.]|nr:2-hydroxychromene-2-carboxylate isomerase [Reyranella sp.]